MPSDDLQQCIRDIQVLKDTELIKCLKHRYFRCLDTANLSELAELLDENMTTNYVGGSYRIDLTDRDSFLEMIGNAFHADAVTQHNGHHPEITILNDTEATGIWYLHDVFIDLRRMASTVGTALYSDRYVKTDGQWKIKHTSYERLYEIVEEIKERPNLKSHYLASHGRKTS